MKTIQEVEKLLGSFAPRIHVQKLVKGKYYEKKTQAGLLYCRKHTDEHGQLYYSYGCWKENDWSLPSLEQMYKYFRIDLVGCLVKAQQGEHHGKYSIMAIPRKDRQRKLLSGIVWS